MFLKKRRDENLRVLTEREIQEKLYGHFRQKTVAVEEEEAVPAVQEPPQKTERDLFVPAAEPVEKKEPLYKPSFSRIGTMSTHWSSFCSLSLLDQWSGCMEG